MDYRSNNWVSRLQIVISDRNNCMAGDIKNKTQDFMFPEGKQY